VSESLGQFVVQTGGSTGEVVLDNWTFSQTDSSSTADSVIINVSGAQLVIRGGIYVTYAPALNGGLQIQYNHTGGANSVPLVILDGPKFVTTNRTLATLFASGSDPNPSGYTVGLATWVNPSGSANGTFVIQRGYSTDPSVVNLAAGTSSLDFGGYANGTIFRTNNTPASPGTITNIYVGSPATACIAGSFFYVFVADGYGGISHTTFRQGNMYWSGATSYEATAGSIYQFVCGGVNTATWSVFPIRN
jgi:hypothetical protein